MTLKIYGIKLYLQCTFIIFFFVCVQLDFIYICIFIGEQINNLESLSFKISMQTLLFNDTLLCTFVARRPYSCM